MTPTGRRSSPSSSSSSSSAAAAETTTASIITPATDTETTSVAVGTGVVSVAVSTGTTAAATHTTTLKRQYKETLEPSSKRPNRGNISTINDNDTNSGTIFIDNVVTNNTATTTNGIDPDELKYYEDENRVAREAQEVVLEDDDNEELFYPEEVYNCINRVNNYNAHLDENEIADIREFADILYDIEQEQEQYQQVDDDNDDDMNSNVSLNVTLNPSWGHTGICNRRKVIGTANSTAYLLPFLVPIEHQKQLQQQFQRRLSATKQQQQQQQQQQENQQPISLFQLFEYLFPVDFIKTIIIPNINKKLSARRAKIVHVDGNNNDDDNEKQNHHQFSTAAAHDDDITNIWDVTYGEFIRFIGLFFAISTYVGIEPYQFWSNEPITPFHGAPIRFHMYMAWVRFEEIFYSLPSSFTSIALLSDIIDTSTDKNYSNTAPSISNTTTTTTNTRKNSKTNTVSSTGTNSTKTTITTKTTSSSTNCIDNDDKFVHVREMIESFNSNMENNFVSGWISATGTSIMPWTSRQQNTCPGLVYNAKQSLFGNCFHTICCGTSGILYSIDLDERTTSTKQQRRNANSTAVDHITRLTKSLQSTGKVVILNSNYGGFHGVKELLEKGIFASGKITKKDSNRNGDHSLCKNSTLQWPSHIDGDMIQDHFSTVPVGTYDSIGGTFDSTIGSSPTDDSDYSLTLKKSFDIYCLKKGTSNISMILSSYGTNNTPALPSSSSSSSTNDDSKFSDYDGYYYIDTNTGKKVTYTPSEVVYYYDKYINTVDRHNNKRLHTSTSSFEFRWGTDNWERRVFAFLLAITEVNVMLADRYFNSDNKTSETTNADAKSKDKPNQAKNQYEFRQQLALALIENPYYDDSDIGEEEHQHCHHLHHHHDQPCTVHSSSNQIDTNQNASNTSNSNSRRRGRHTSNADLHGPATACTPRTDTPVDSNHSHDVASTATTATAAATLASIGGTGSDDIRSVIVHELLTIPRGHKFSKEGGGQQLVLAKSDYPQRPCVGCKKKVRTYCRCTPGTLLCNECYCAHNIETRQRQQQLLLQQQHQQQQQQSKKQCRPAGAPSYEA